MQRAESSPATEHTPASAESTMELETVVAELSQLSTDSARDTVHAAQILLTGNQQDVRNLCKPWEVQLNAKKRKRPMETIRQELKMAVTKRAKELKTEHEAYHRDQHPATEHTTADARIETMMEHPSQPLQNRATSSTSRTAESMVELDPNTSNYPNLVELPDAELVH